MNTTPAFSGLESNTLIALATDYARTPVNTQTMLACSRELISRGLLREAQAMLIRLLQSDKFCIQAYELLASSFESMGAWRSSISVWQQLLTLNSKNMLALSRLGALHLMLGEWELARKTFEWSATLNPGELQTLVGLAFAHLGLQDFPKLATVRDILLARIPHHAHAQLIDGHCHRIAGRHDRAVTAYRAALTANPELTDAMFSLVDLERPSTDSELACRLENLRRGPINGRDRVNVCFSLARIFESAKRYGDAFDCYQEGNRVTLQLMSQLGFAYDPNATMQRAERTMKMYGRNDLSTSIKRLPIDLRLILIVGLPRSGTSLVEQILASHSEVAGGGELPTMQDCVSEFEKRRKSLGIEECVDPRNPRDAALLMEMRDKYLDELFERELDSKIVTDKLPGNFATLGFARLMFPDAIIVHCCRDAPAVCWSLYTAHFGTHEPYYNSFEHLAHYYGVYRRLMDHWRSVLDPPMIEVRYEEIAINAEVEIRRLISECGLKWESACLEFYNSERPVFTASQLQVRQPIYESSIASWKNYQEFLGPFLSLLEEAKGMAQTSGSYSSSAD